MQFSRVLLLGSAVLVATACSSDPVSKVVAPEASAAIRWVNAVSDTVAMDYRVIDYASNASEPALGFQSSSGNWRIVPAGSHEVKAFFFCPASITGLEWCSGTSVVSQVLDDATFNLEANKKYTILHYGFAKAGATPQRSLKLIEDVTPTVPAGQVAIRIINAAPALGAINVYSALATAVGGAVSGSAAFSNVAPGDVTPWVNFPVATGTSSYRVTATSAGGTTPLVDVLAPPGVAAVAATVTTGALDAVPGARQPGSAFTIVVFGPKVSYVLKSPAGVSTTIAGTAAGSSVTLLDVFPPRISP